eukprot:2576314-Alexandrium_andersonii.AAC.1
MVNKGLISADELLEVSLVFMLRLARRAQSCPGLSMRPLASEPGPAVEISSAPVDSDAQAGEGGRPQD